jgi:DnaJ-domain-containing protein 1
MAMKPTGASLCARTLLILSALVSAAADERVVHARMKNEISDRLERASTQLDRTLNSLHTDNFADARTALKGYSAELRQLKVGIEMLRIKESESEFVSSLLDGLDLQISRLDALKIKVQPDMLAALLDAIKQLSGTIRTLRQKWERTLRKTHQ